MATLDQLETDSSAWVSEGIIASEQRDLILDWERARERPRRSLTTIISVIGAVVVILGITLIVATNWDEIPLMTKLAAGVALLVALYATGYWVRYGAPGRAKSGEALMLIGAGTFLGDLALVSQQYHIFESFSVPLLLVVLALVPMPYLHDSRAFAFVAAAAFSAWVGAEMARDGSPISAGGPVEVFLMFVGVGAALVVLGAAHRLTRLFKLSAPIEIIGGSVFLFSVYVLGFYRHLIDFDSGRRDSAPLLDTFSAVLFFGLPAILVVASVSAEVWRSGLPSAFARQRFPILAGAALVLATLLWSVLVNLNPEADLTKGFRGDRMLIPWTAGWWLLAVTLSVDLGWLGVAFGRRAWLNTALVFTGIFVLTRYFDLFSSYAQTGLVFIGAGVLLLVIAFALERSRRVLTKLADVRR